MINEREASRRFFRRETIIFDLRFDEEENSLFSYQIETKNQLRHWVKKNLKVVVFMIQKLIKENMTVMKNYNRVAKIVRNAMKEVEKEASIESIHDEDTSKSVVKEKLIISKKLLDLSIFIDEKDLLTDDWLSIMRNKLKENANWYQIALQKKAYVRIRIDDDAIRHLFSRFKKNSIKSFLNAEEIFEELNLIFNDSNKRVNFMKTFKRLKQIDQFKKFFVFWFKFQRLTSDAKLYDKKMLIEDLKNKMSFEL
jgi:hypothetical protein